MSTALAQRPVAREGLASSQALLVRVGVPVTGGRLLAGAKAAGHAMLLSANAFARVYPRGHEREGSFRRFSAPSALLQGCDVALDSAGFVAAARYGDYRWTVEDHLDLVASHPWTWWAALDYCCEPELAASRPMRLLRLAATAWMLRHCQRRAAERGLPAPMPVIQGWTASEYVMCANWMALSPWPSLVGIGSVCRRSLHGANGMLAIVAALDAIAPAHVRFHMFGVKGSALSVLAGHPRIASVDSMAWDVQARAERRTGRDVDFRLSHMQAWMQRQAHASACATQRPALQADLLSQARDDGAVDVHLEPVQRREDALGLCVAMHTCELLIDGEIEYADARTMLAYDTYVAQAIVSRYGWGREAVEQLDDHIGGLGERLERMLEESRCAA